MDTNDDIISHYATGGTLDSVWDPVADTARPANGTCVERYLRDVARIPAVESETIVIKASIHV
jgi:hypothetical protein